MLKSKVLHNEMEQGSSEQYWKSVDGTKLFSKTWIPSGAIKGIVSLAHDFCAYTDRYSNFINAITSKGYLVRSFDFRGHGKSDGKRGYSSGYRKMLQDMASFLDEGIENYPDIPHFIYAHGFGANMVLNHYISNQQNISGIIISSPWFERTNEASGFKRMMMDTARIFLPALILNAGFRAEDMSRDLKMVHNYRVNPLIHDRINLKLLLQTIEAGEKASKSIYKINVPLLVMHGTDDRVTNHKVTDNFVRNSSKRTTYIEWEGGYHELHNDIIADKVLNTVTEWLDSKLT